MPGSDVQELGRLLRETRVYKGATLADAQQATKIRQSFLQALENEDYSVLPPPFYIRGFIKTYASFLGLDPQGTVRLFDDLLNNESTAHLQPYRQPSADSGGHNPSIALNGLSQGEARLVEASNEKLNLSALPAPTLPGYLAPYNGHNQENQPGGEQTRAIVPVNPRNQLVAQNKYVLKPVMLPTTRGAFYMPNFVPTLLVIIIIIAAGLLIYRGITSAQEGEKNNANATATANAFNNPNQIDLTASPGIFNLSPTPANLLTPTGAGLVGRQTGGTNPNPTSAILTPPPFYTPDAAIAALDNSVATALANSSAPSPRPGPTPTPAPPPPTPVPPNPTPVPNPITVEVTVGTSDPKGSWMGIVVDGQEKVAKIAQPGEVFVFQGRQVAVRAGNPGVITIKVNGEVKEYTKPQAGIITHTWFADGRDTVTQ